MGRPVVHFEVGCSDSAKTQKFYRDLFDWKIEPQGAAATIEAEPDGISGHITALGYPPHQYTTLYVQVDDVAATLKHPKATPLDCGSRKLNTRRSA